MPGERSIQGTCPQSRDHPRERVVGCKCAHYVTASFGSSPVWHHGPKSAPRSRAGSERPTPTASDRFVTDLLHKQNSRTVHAHLKCSFLDTREFSDGVVPQTFEDPQHQGFPQSDRQPVDRHHQHVHLLAADMLESTLRRRSSRRSPARHRSHASCSRPPAGSCGRAESRSSRPKHRTVPDRASSTSHRALERPPPGSDPQPRHRRAA